MKALDRITQRRAALRREMAATRRATTDAAVALGRDAALALAAAAAGRFLARRFRWGGVVAAALGFIATRILRR